MTQSIDSLRTLCIGREMDGGVQDVRIDCADWRNRYPDLTDYRLEVTQPNGLVYLPVVHMEGDVLVWPITDSDTREKGSGVYQVVATGADGQRKTSAHPTLFIAPIMPGTVGEEVPSPSQSWVDEVLDAAERAEDAAKKAEDIANGITPGGSGGITEDEYEVIADWNAPADWGTNIYTWNELAHKKLIIIVDAPAGTADSTLEYVWAYKSLCYASKGIRNGSKSKTVCIIDTYIVNDGETKKRYLKAACSEYGYESDTAQNKWVSRGYGIPGTLAFGEKTAIDQIMLRTEAGKPLPEGTKITIWGVKA